MLETCVLPFERLPMLPGPDEEPQDTGRALRGKLERGWWILRGGRIATADAACTIDFILLHREIGVALVRRGRLDYTVPALAVRAVRARLEQQGFSERFVGFLPVVWIAMEEDAASALGARLARAFAAEPPLELAGEGWVDFVADVLAPAAETANPAAGADCTAGAPAATRHYRRFIVPAALASCAAAATAAVMIAISLVRAEPVSPPSSRAVVAAPAPLVAAVGRPPLASDAQAVPAWTSPPRPELWASPQPVSGRGASDPAATAAAPAGLADAVAGSTVAEVQPTKALKQRAAVRPRSKPVRVAQLTPRETAQPVPLPSAKPERSFWSRIVQPMPSHFEDHAGNNGAWTSR